MNISYETILKTIVLEIPEERNNCEITLLVWMDLSLEVSRKEIL